MISLAGVPRAREAQRGKLPKLPSEQHLSHAMRAFTTPTYRPFMRDLARGRGRAAVLPSRPTVHAQLATLAEWLLGGLTIAMLARGLIG